MGECEALTYSCCVCRSCLLVSVYACMRVSCACHVRKCEWVSEWVSKWVLACLCIRVFVCLCVCMCVCVCVCVNFERVCLHVLHSQKNTHEVKHTIFYLICGMIVGWRSHWFWERNVRVRKCKSDGVDVSFPRFSVVSVRELKAFCPAIVIGVLYRTNNSSDIRTWILQWLVKQMLYSLYFFIINSFLNTRRSYCDNRSLIAFEECDFPWSISFTYVPPGHSHKWRKKDRKNSALDDLRVKWLKWTRLQDSM